MKIGVIGAGSWGTALASLLVEGKDSVVLWAFEGEVATSINQNHRNYLYLAEAPFPKNLKSYSVLKEVVEGSSVFDNFVPSHLARGVWERAAPFVDPDALIVNASKIGRASCR